MKIIKFISLALLALTSLAVTQTIEIAKSVFYNEEGAILLAIDACLAVKKIDSPYVPFIAFLATGGNQRITVNRTNVVMIYQGKEYRMPSFKEWRAKYHAAEQDRDIYDSLNQEWFTRSQMKKYRFAWEQDFFPLRDSRPLASPSYPSTPSPTEPRVMKTLGDYFNNAQGHGSLPTEQGTLEGIVGFKTRLYFENPGFKAGDQLVIMACDTKNPELKGTCTILLR